MSNSFRYLPDTEQDQKEMLDTLNLSSVDELFDAIPSEIRDKEELNIPEAEHESTLMKRLSRMAGKNLNADEYPMFLGAGTYDHYIPSVVSHITGRSEFYTAYTPYQPEVSQGELQAMFEFQTMVSELTGLPIANSSMYDGFTALAEAASMAVDAKKKAEKVLISGAVHPESHAALKPVALAQEYDVEEVPLKNDITDLDKLAEQIDETTAAVIVQYPNFFGSIEDLQKVSEIAKEKEALLIVSANPLALGLLEAPGNLGADIVVGDMQPLGIPMSFGGPHCGYFVTTKKFMRKIPGRIVGQTQDDHGNRGFVLTLQAREQHIRREKATSNICSNQALNALASSVCMSALGKHGIRKMAQLNIEKANYMKNRLKEKGFTVMNQSPIFNELVVELPISVSAANDKLLEEGIIGGFDLNRDYGKENQMLLAITDQRTKEEIDQFIDVLEGAAK